MGHPLYGANQAGSVIGSSVITVESDALSAAGQRHVRVPFDCTIREIHYAVNVALTTAKSTVTFKADGNGVTGAAAFEIPTEAAIGASGVFKLTTGNVIKAGSCLEIEHDAAPGAGQATWTIVCDAS